MPTIRENLDAGFTVPPDDAEQEAQGIRWAMSFYRALGRGGGTDFGTALALEPVILTGISVAANIATVPLGLVSAVEATLAGSPGPRSIRLVGLAANQVRATIVGANVQLEFFGADAVTECAVMMLRAPAPLVAALDESME